VGNPIVWESGEFFFLDTLQSALLLLLRQSDSTLSNIITCYLGSLHSQTVGSGVNLLVAGTILSSLKIV
jgi:hypothetical protein